MANDLLMKKILFLLAFIFFSHQAQTPVENEFKRPVTFADKKAPAIVQTPSQVLAPRAPSRIASGARSPAQAAPATVRPIRLSHLVVKDPTIKSSTGEWIASNITALPLASYDASFGKEIYRDVHFAYFAGKTEESLPVAFNPVDQSFHPISQVLLLKKIDEELRREIVDEGHKEYYYNQRMGYLSIQSNSQEVLSLYSEFKKRGLDVRLEVLKETAQPR
jgi:hypothetical protein